MDKNKLKEIIEQHGLWLSSGGSQGERADLRYADLRSADLRYANLRYANLRSADLRSADLPSKYLYVGNIGSRNSMTTYSFKEDKVWCGCWSGKLKDFEKRVKDNYKEGIHRAEYLGLIAYIKIIAKEQK